MSIFRFLNRSQGVCGRGPCGQTFDRRAARKAGHPGHCSRAHHEYEEVVMRAVAG